MTDRYRVRRISAHYPPRTVVQRGSRFVAEKAAGGLYREGHSFLPVQGETPDDVAAAMRRSYPGALPALPPDLEPGRSRERGLT